MRINTFSKCIFVVICLFLSWGLQAQVVSDTINVTAGNLNTQLGSKKDLITNLTLTGNVNGTDIGTIRSMAKLSVLNMADVNIVSGGKFYADYFDRYTKDNQIPSLMFYGLNNITSLIIPNSVTFIGNSAFTGCSFSSISIPNSVTSIGDYAFSDCSLTSVSIPNSVTSIGSAAFYRCGRLTSITIPNSVTFIGDDVFFACRKLISITIPDSVTSIGNNVFWYCSGLVSITLSNNITFIGDNAFNGCSVLTSIILPNGVTSIGSKAFQECSRLTSITIPNGVTSIGNNAFMYSGLVSITLPKKITSIGSETFYGCGKLNSISIPNNVSYIGDRAFYGCSRLISITIPSNVDYIGDSEFAFCSGLTEIYCKKSTPLYALSSTFNGVSKTNCKLYVPKGSIAAYKSAEGWKDFSIVLEDESTAISDLETNSSSVYAELGNIVIKNAELGKIVFVYNTLGTLLQTVKVTDNEVRVNLPVNQIYFIRIADKRYKVVL